MSNCQHLIVKRWRFKNDDTLADLWSCEDCKLRFEPINAAQQRYEASNPLGGPAKLFDAIADRIRAGEDYYSVLADYGVTVGAK